ncbi:MAG: hypothetical protein GF309_15955 [Candidatus Lokiarchaeota archaeon]|nr:hypothetical protein [Candidatus Lokiarchaeota archaeon]
MLKLVHPDEPVLLKQAVNLGLDEIVVRRSVGIVVHTSACRGSDPIMMAYGTALILMLLIGSALLSYASEGMADSYEVGGWTTEFYIGNIDKIEDVLPDYFVCWLIRT